MPVPILAYHLVTDNFDLGFARTNLKQFKRQMCWLHENGYQTLTLSENLNKLRPGNNDRNFQKRIVLTFDDAYASLENAYEIMSEYGFVGTCFAISDYIGKDNSWDYQFGSRKIQHADAGFLKKLMNTGWEIGSHSCRHSHLASLPEEIVYKELSCSKEKIADLTSAAVHSISYPFGYTDNRVCTIASNCGYQCGVGLGLPLHKQLILGRMCLPRLGIYLFDTLYSFAKKLAAFARYKRSAFFMQQIISFGTKGTILLKKW
ncbi:MAG: polysaccharide deacetylase family protein, partial [bacterium]